jgi:hypothetical protein
MPTVTYDMGTTTAGGDFVNDGGGYLGSFASSINDGLSQNLVKPWDGLEEFAGWLRFVGITIPQGTIITSAKLNLFILINDITTASAVIEADGRKTPGVPTNISRLFSNTNIADSTTRPISVESTGLATKSLYFENEIIVTNLVQTLVGTPESPNYDYNNGEMVFYQQGTGGRSFLIYARDWGATKQSTLQITYGVVDKTVYRFV